MIFHVLTGRRRSLPRGSEPWTPNLAPIFGRKTNRWEPTVPALVVNPVRDTCNSGALRLLGGWVVGWVGWRCALGPQQGQKWAPLIRVAKKRGGAPHEYNRILTLLDG